MKRSRMSRAWMLPACVWALAALPAGWVRAQGQPQQAQSQYQGLGDSPETPSTLDKDYGMSFLGAPGSDGQKKTAPPATDPATSDFFQRRADNGIPADIRLPRPRNARPSETETPLYTTTEGSETGDARQASETPLFDDGSDTADGGANPAATGMRR